MPGRNDDAGSSDTRAQDGDAPDRITLRDHLLEIEIGAFQEERGRTQRVRFNIEAELAKRPATQRDDVDEILSYDVLVQAIEDELGAGRVNLLETIAEGIAVRLLSHRGVRRAHVAVEKLDRSSGALGVSITRDAAAAVAEPGGHAEGARVVFLDRDAMTEPHLTSLIDRIADTGGAVLCVAPLAAAPFASNALVQRRLDLLQIEQSAWLLADRDPRCLVIDSRTELEWALRQRRIAVWAPSKLVLDNREAPAEDARQLAAWLADLLGAAEVELPGDAEGA